MRRCTAPRVEGHLACRVTSAAIPQCCMPSPHAAPPCRIPHTRLTTLQCTSFTRRCEVTRAHARQHNVTHGRVQAHHALCRLCVRVGRGCGRRHDAAAQLSLRHSAPSSRLLPPLPLIASPTPPPAACTCERPQQRCAVPAPTYRRVQTPLAAPPTQTRRRQEWHLDGKSRDVESRGSH